MNRPSDIEKLSSDKRLAWRALSTLGAQLPLMDAALSVEEVPPAAGMPAATVTVLIMRISCTSAPDLAPVPDVCSNRRDKYPRPDSICRVWG